MTSSMVHPSYGNVGGSGFDSGIGSHNSSIHSSHQKTRSQINHKGLMNGNTAMNNGSTLQPNVVSSHNKNSLSMGSSTLNHAMLHGGMTGGSSFDTTKVKVSAGGHKSSNRKRVLKTTQQSSFNAAAKSSSYSFH